MDASSQASNDGYTINYEDIAILNVSGAEPRSFKIHASLLSKYSEYFRDALAADTNREFDMVNMFSCDVAEFISWAYVYPCDKPTTTDRPSLEDLCYAWMVGYRLRAWEYSNQAMSRILQAMEASPSQSLCSEKFIENIYRLSPSGCPLRQVLVDRFIEDSLIKEELFTTEYHPQFVYDLGITLTKAWRNNESRSTFVGPRMENKWKYLILSTTMPVAVSNDEGAVPTNKTVFTPPESPFSESSGRPFILSDRSSVHNSE